MDNKELLAVLKITNEDEQWKWADYLLKLIVIL